jgi:hypothetical protein
VQVAQSLVDTGANANKIFRYDAREGYRTNYLAATTLYGVAADVVRRDTGDLVNRDYPAFLARAMYAGFLSVYIVACAVFVGIAASGRRGTLVIAVTVTIAVIAALETLFDAFGDTWWGLPVLLPDAETAETFWQVFGPNFPGMILNPQVQMSPFGDTPRNHFVLLALAVFVLRWRQNYIWSYALLFALSLLHQSQTGLLTAYLVGADALLRPQRLRSLAGAFAVLTIATYIGRESLGDVIGIARPPVIAAAAAAAAGVLALLWLGLRSRAASRAGTALTRWRNRLLTRGDVAGDLIVIAIFWTATFPIAALINSLGTERQSIYFWSQLHGRSMGILRPAFILGLVIFALDRWARARPATRVGSIALLCAALALVPSALLAATYQRTPVARLEMGLRDMDRSIGARVDFSTIGALSEEQIYYALARELDQQPR